ncbi:MAG: sugar phosphate isomerase/epimerase [Acidobacteriaceae bacterium]|nr:sugar phosphate isomerase/epimerase [Acidobacteriaceae bacterium]
MTCFSRRTFLAAMGATVVSRGLQALPLEEIKLGVTTDEISDDPAIAADFLKRFRLHYGEVRNMFGKYNTELPAAKVQEARTAFDARDVKISIVDTALFRGAIPADGTALDKEWTLLEAAMERGDILGCKLLRIFAFMPPKGGDVMDGSVFPRTYELLREGASRAGKRGFRVAVENLKGSYVQTGADSARLLKAVKNANFGVNWDPNNAAGAGEKPFPDGYSQIDPSRIFHVHLRDFKHNAEGGVDWMPVGQGEFDNVAQIRALRHDGFRGTYSLETHWRSPQGKAYATEVSLKGLLQVIEKV